MNRYLRLVGVEVLGFEIWVNPRLRIRASARFGHYKVMSYEMNEKIFAEHPLNFSSHSKDYFINYCFLFAYLIPLRSSHFVVFTTILKHYFILKKTKVTD